MGSDGERALETLIRYHGWPTPTREYRFHLARRWRFDFAWPTRMLAVEVEGGTWISGAHSRGSHFESDCEKYNAAAIAGWCVLRFTTDMVTDGRLVAVLTDLFAGDAP